MIIFGKKIALLRKDLGLSQTELAKKINTSVSVISRYEREEMIPSIDTAKKIIGDSWFYRGLSSRRNGQSKSFQRSCNTPKISRTGKYAIRR